MKDIYIKEEDKFLKKDKMILPQNSENLREVGKKRKLEEDKLLNKVIISLKNEDYGKLSKLAGSFPISIFTRSIIINYLHNN